MTSYNNKQDFETMQQEAIKRVREMQKKANSYIKEPEKKIEQQHSPHKEQPPIKSTPNTNNDVFMKNNNNRNNFQSRPQNSANRTYSNNAPKKNTEKPKEEKKHEDAKTPPPNQNKQYNRQYASNPFAQLFGSNLGGFNKYKNSSDEEKKNDNIITDISGSLGKLLKDFSIDEEKLLILLLIYILYKNGADLKLLLALGYLVI